MLKVGITGGIGSGKTWVCRVFQHLGVPLFEADSEVKKLYQTDSNLKAELLKAFGSQAYNREGIFNTTFFREVLSDPLKRKVLNDIVHPKIFQRFEEWSREQKASYVIKEAAILFESGADKTVHKTIGFFAPLELRIQRVMQRDNRTRESILGIMNMQLPEDELRQKVDYAITNDNEQSVIEQVRNLHQILLKISSEF